MSHTSAIINTPQPSHTHPLSPAPARPGETPARRALPEDPSTASNRSADRTGDRAQTKRELRPADSVDLSPAARPLQAATPAPGRSASASPTDEPVRGDLVTRIRSLIADGRYDTAERLDAAANKLIGQLDVEA